MKISAKTKKYLKVAALLGAAFAVYRYGTPLVRMKRDAANPATGIGADFQASFGAQYDAAHIAAGLENQIKGKRIWYDRYMKKGWAFTQGIDA